MPVAGDPTPYLPDTFMRWIGLILVALALGGAWACWIELDDPPSWESTRWVRTRDGWEEARSLGPPPAVFDSDIHPLLFAAALVLFSLLLLVSFSRDRSADH